MASRTDKSGRVDFSQVQDVLAQLHKSGVVDLDKSVRETLATGQGLGGLGGGEVATSVIAWDGYALIIKSDVIDMVQLASVAEQLRGATRGQ